MNITKKFKQNTSQSITLLLLIGILVVANIISYQIFYRWDLTKNKVFSISQASKTTVAELPDVVNIKAYFSDNLPSQFLSIRQQVADILDEYQNYSGGKIRVEFINPGDDDASKQDLYMKGIPQLTFNVIEKDKAQVVNGYMGIEIGYGGKTEVIPAVKQNATDLEYQITTAIKKVTSEQLGTVGFLTGQGSAGPDSISDAKKALGELYQVEEFNFTDKKEIPDTINTLIIVGPKEKFSDEQLKAINSFMVRGGSLIALVDGVKIEQGLQATKNETNLEKLFSKYGFTLNQDLVGDNRNGMASFSQGFVTFSTAYPYWPKITNESFDKNNSAVSSLETVIFPWASSIDIDTSKIDQKSVSRLAVTTDKAWRLVDSFSIAPNNVAPSGEQKQYTLAASVNGKMKSAYPAKDKKEGEEFDGKLAIVGDSDFIFDNFVRGVPDNLVFFQNLIDSFSLGNDLISIRAKTITMSPIKEGITDSQRISIRYANVLGITIIVVAFGVLRYYLRRRSKFVDEI